MKTELLEIYENAAYQVEGDLSLLAILVLFFEPKKQYSLIKKDLDNSENIEQYKEIFEKINEMNMYEIKLFYTCYNESIDGLIGWLREAIVDKYKKQKPKANIETSKCPKGIKTKQETLF